MTQAQERQFQVGDQVILGEHQADPNGKFGKNWDSQMDKYVGKVATITRIEGVSPGDRSGSICYRVDSNTWMWRGINMTLFEQAAVDLLNSIAKSTAYGAKCGKCQEYNEYATASDSFICYGCSH